MKSLKYVILQRMEEYQIIHPSPLLAPYVKNYWFLKTDNVTQPVQRIIPTGNVCLIFHKGENMFSLSKGEKQPKAFISGQSTGYSNIQPGGTVDMISVTFQPHGFKAFFSLSVNQLLESTISIEDISDPALTELQSYLMDTPNISSCIQLIEAFLMKRLTIAKAYNFQRMNAVMQSINTGQTNIENLAETSCLGYKQFKRIFSEYIGINPKDFLRIIRFQRALYMLQICPKTSLTQLALECGYYDQPHFIKEFKTFSGYTPSEYVSISTPYSDYFS